MFQTQAAIFYYAVSPVHMGAGTSVGVVDNPIQRERHTEHPCFAGSGLKGAFRHHFAATQVEDSANLGNLEHLLFGPPSAGELHAGAVSLGDAQLVAFPVRSLKESYAYVTCPLALARAQRLLAITGLTVDWKIPCPTQGACAVSGPALLVDKKLYLEVFEYTANEDSAIIAIANDLAKLGLPDSTEFQFFTKKISQHLVVLNDTDFAYFAKNATLVEPHVRIDNETGAAKKGGLFYTENLPPEALLVGPVMASQSRAPISTENLSAAAVMTAFKRVFDGNLLQIGGNATTGRGLVMLKFAEVAGQ